MSPLSSPHPKIIQQLLRLASIGSLLVLIISLSLLIFLPELGLKIIWSLIIPLAPLFFFLAPNIWTSLCPFAIIQSIPRRFGFSKNNILNKKQIHYLRLISWGLLFILVPARHLFFNHDSLILLLTTLALLLIVFFCGYFYKGLSGWCVSACPIRPVEMMYGQFSHETHRPEICSNCAHCNAPCSRQNIQNKKILQANNIRFKPMIFAFPGFVLGYYLTSPDMSALNIYGVIYGLSLVSWAIFFFIDKYQPSLKIMNQAIIFALLTYYAFTIPKVSSAWGLPSIATPVLYTLTYSIIGLSLLLFYRRYKKQP